MHGTRVTAAWTFRDEHDTPIDDSDRSGPMDFIVGQRSVLPAIEDALIGHQSGDQLHLVLDPEHAFGPHRPELVFEAARANLPLDIDLSPGTELYSGMGDRPKFRLRVLKATDAGALLDGNHPLAGKTLKIDLEVLSTGTP